MPSCQLFYSEKGEGKSRRLFCLRARTKYIGAKNPAFNDFYADVYADALSQIAAAHNPDVVLIGSAAAVRNWRPAWLRSLMPLYHGCYRYRTERKMILLVPATRWAVTRSPPKCCRPLKKLFLFYPRRLKKRRSPLGREKAVEIAVTVKEPRVDCGDEG